MSILKAKTEYDDLPFSLFEIPEQSVDMLPQHDRLHISFWRYYIRVRHKISEIGVILFTNRGFQRSRLPRNLHDFLYLFLGHVQVLCKFLHRWLIAKLQRQLPLHLGHLIDRLDHMHRHADGTCLICQCTRNRLTDPPGCVSGELKALGWVKLFYALDQSKISFLHKIQEAHASSGITLGDGNHKPQVCFNKSLFCILITLLLFDSQLVLLLIGQERYRTNLFKIHADRILGSDSLQEIYGI